jgi:spermidine/putrescine transport system substrate-binding protein
VSDERNEMPPENEMPPDLGAAFLRGMTHRRMSRRNLIRYAGMTVGSMSLASILAACGGGSSSGGTGSGGGNTVDWNKPPGTEINFANWPLYIDKTKDASGNVVHPSLDSFTKATGIQVRYEEAIQDNAEFFGRLQPQLQAGQDTGWDIIVITNGREFTALTANQWVTPLDASNRPNFDANAATWAKNPVYDPGNKYSMAWQSGITNIGYNKDLVKAPIVTMDDLADPSKVPPNSVGMLKGDMPDWVMVNLGIDPGTSGPTEWKEAAAWLQKQKDSGVVRQYYDQGYADDLTAGNLAATMAWSGDVLYYNTWSGYDNLVFVSPGAGGTKSALLWIDNMMIPAHSANPQGALELMDYVYKPEVAQMITEWVLYMSPVPAVQKLIADHAKKAEAAGDKGYANKLALTAENPLLWPDPQLLSLVKFGKQLKTDAERQEWDSIFLPISEG